MLETILRIAASLKLSASEPVADPVSPMIPRCPFGQIVHFHVGLSCARLHKSHGLQHTDGSFQKRIDKFDVHCLPFPFISADGLDYLLMLSMIFLIFSFRTSAVNGLTM
jgi:hypothetical protein